MIRIIPRHRQIGATRARRGQDDLDRSHSGSFPSEGLGHADSCGGRPPRSGKMSLAFATAESARFRVARGVDQPGGIAMTHIELRTKVGPDGVLRFSVPVGWPRSTGRSRSSSSLSTGPQEGVGDDARGVEKVHRRDGGFLAGRTGAAGAR